MSTSEPKKIELVNTVDYHINPQDTQAAILSDVTEIATQMTSDAPSTPNKVDEIMPAKMVTPIKPAGTKKNVGKPSPREGGATIK